MRRWPYLLPFCLALAACGEETPAPKAGGEVPGVPAEGPVSLVGGKIDGVSSPSVDDPLPADADLGAAFEALFAPDDPNFALEIALIDRVIAARAADAEAPTAEGENPYRIRYACYNISHPDIYARLADAADKGVDVQILIEAHQLDPEKPWNQIDEYLAGRGFEVSFDRDALSKAERVTYDLIGVKTGGLMHLKTRLFETPAGRTLLTGSQNPGASALLNDETLHLINDPALTGKYAAFYDRLLAGEGAANAWDEAAAVNVLFTPAKSGPRAGTQLLRWIAEEEEQILLAVFSLRDVRAAGVDRSLVELLGDKAKAGVPVYVITDRKQSDGVDAQGNRIYRDDDTEDRLRRAGVHVFEGINRANDFTAMHQKVAILGRTRVRVVTDAANWSYSALGSDRRVAKNTESMLFIDSARLDDGATGRRYLGQWLRVLGRYAADSARDEGEPTFEKVYAALTAEGWPTVPVGFVAFDTETDWGEAAVVVGDHDALGAWGEAGDGVKLGTDADAYPTWQGEVALPVGTPFLWKLTVQGAGRGVTWEAGDDRAGFARSTALLPVETARHEATWR